MDCIFCKIVSGEIATDVIAQNDFCIAFNDIHPKAPTHILIIPKIHKAKLSELTDDERQSLFDFAENLAQKSVIAESGFRIAMNLGRDAGQEVQHLHMHLLGGRQSTGLY